ncbi:MAG TPA: lipopolysaccharide heptosyltransferase II [Myxococcales bacterium]
MSDPKSVLVVQTAYLGDTVFTSALVASLAARWPSARIELCVSPRGRDVALAMPAAAAVHVFDKRGTARRLAGLRRMAMVLRERKFDLAVLPHRSLRTALLARLARIPERVGFSGTLPSLLYTARVASSQRGFLDREADLGRHFGATPQPMRLLPRPEWIDAARATLSEASDHPLAGICLGSEWETKIWPEQRMAELAVSLRERGYRPVLLGGPRERATAREIASATDCLDTTGNSIGEALAILSFCSLAVGGDTGLVHAARALSVPTVALFGPTTPAVHHFGERELAVSLDLSCSPCSAHGSRRCPLGHHRCLRDLDAARVATACLQVARKGAA